MATSDVDQWKYVMYYYSGYIWCRPVKEKINYLKNLIGIIRLGQNISEIQLKRSITDGGKEFDNRTLKDWDSDEGVRSFKRTP